MRSISTLSLIAVIFLSTFVATPTAKPQLAFHPLKAYQPHNHVAPLLQSNPNNQNITHEHHISLNIPSLSAQDILFVKDQAHHFYVYRQETKNHQSTCIIGILDLETSAPECIKVHENILAHKALELECFITNQKAECNPILLMYDNATETAQELDDFIEKFCTKNRPYQSFTTPDTTRHSIWRISDDFTNEYIQNLCAHFSSVYVADGHHRLAVAKNLHKKFPLQTPYHYVLAALASSSQLELKAFHRIIKNTTLSPKEIMDIVAQNFDIIPLPLSPQTPSMLHDFALFIDNTWHQLILKHDTMNRLGITPLETLDSFIVQELIISPIQQQSSVKIAYIGGINTYAELEQNCTHPSDIILALAAVPIKQFIDIVDEGFLMPPKSTWFEPKLPPGVVVYSLM